MNERTDLCLSWLFLSKKVFVHLIYLFSLSLKFSLNLTLSVCDHWFSITWYLLKEHRIVDRWALTNSYPCLEFFFLLQLYRNEGVMGVLNETIVSISPRSNKLDIKLLKVVSYMLRAELLEKRDCDVWLSCSLWGPTEFKFLPQSFWYIKNKPSVLCSNGL